jgi:hypothetical protein
MSNTKKDLFNFLLKQVRYRASTDGLSLPQAFVKWFSLMYFPGFYSYELTDGSGDGKVDALIKCEIKNSTSFHIINSKFTEKYENNSPVAFYDEITRFWMAFKNKDNRNNYLNVVREELKAKYKNFFKLYDNGIADLFFITNHKKNDKQFAAIKTCDVKIIHSEDILSYVADHIEGAMPETEPLIFSGISTVLTPAKHETEVPTSIVFARLVDFINYMDDDPFELLFARNVRLWLGKTEPNKAIEETFRDNPREFAFSNNGITILCKKHIHDPGSQELKIENPRVVNGSQTLHSIRYVDNPNKSARVMVRIIEVPPESRGDITGEIFKRKDIIHKISIRSNMQNPIKRWNLVSNDDFHNSLSQYFWQKGLYYERRQNEWKLKSGQLKNQNIRKGPSLKEMVQIISSYFYDEKNLGSANAQGRLNALFEENAYAKIMETNPQLSYQLYLIYNILCEHLSLLKRKKKYIAALGNYAKLALFSGLCKYLKSSGYRFGNIENEISLVKLLGVPSKDFGLSLKMLIDYYLKVYGKMKSRVYKQERQELNYQVYFKNAALIKSLINDLPEKGSLRKITNYFKFTV